MVMDAFETFEVGEHHVVEFFVFHISFVLLGMLISLFFSGYRMVNAPRR